VIRLSDLRSQVTGLYADLKVAVDADPKAPAGAATRSLLRRLAEQGKNEAHDKRAAETVLDALTETASTGMSVADAFALVGQLMRALRTTR
jgi:hypothetical protein